MTQKMYNCVRSYMKRCTTLDEVVGYIQRKHRNVNARQKGVHGFKMLRKPSGQRLLFEEIHGWRIFKYKVHNETTLVIKTLATGLLFRGNQEVRASSTLFLNDLIVVNVYDNRAEFFTGSSIDFAYIEADYAVELQLLTEWVNQDPGVLRAQWLTPKNDYDRILEEISTGGKEVVLSDNKPRFINMGPRGL